jgi:hypothetical protein
MPTVKRRRPRRLRSVTAARAGIPRFIGAWGIPIVGAAATILFLGVLPRAVGDAVGTASIALYWLPLAAMWIAAGKNLVSIALWLVPAVSLSVAWLLGIRAGIEWWIAAVSIGILCISFLPPAVELWAVLVSRLMALLLRLSRSRLDRQVDDAAESVRRRLWVAAYASPTKG